MSMMLQFKDLWDGEGYGKDNPLENTIAYLNKVARKLGIDEDTVEIVVSEIMAEVAAGRKFPLDKCPCGCGIDKSGTAITHEMRDRLRMLDKNIKAYKIDLLQRRLNAAIEAHMSRENQQYIEQNMKPSAWKRAKEAVGGFRLFRNRKQGNVPDPDAD